MTTCGQHVVARHDDLPFGEDRQLTDPPQSGALSDAADVLGPQFRPQVRAPGSNQFLDGHVRALAHFDGVPARVAYDNLRGADAQILVGGARTLTPRFAALASYYLGKGVSVSKSRTDAVAGGGIRSSSTPLTPFPASCRIDSRAQPDAARFALCRQALIDRRLGVESFDALRSRGFREHWGTQRALLNELQW